jgi:hypothetical protein
MLFDIGLVIACHFITTNITLLSTAEPKSSSKAVRVSAIVTILVGTLAIIDLVVKKIFHLV